MKKVQRGPAIAREEESPYGDFARRKQEEAVQRLEIAIDEQLPEAIAELKNIISEAANKAKTHVQVNLDRLFTFCNVSHKEISRQLQERIQQWCDENELDVEFKRTKLHHVADILWGD